MMLKKSITLDDMQSVVSNSNIKLSNPTCYIELSAWPHPQDVELWNSFTYILENDPEPLCLSFSVNKTVFGEVHCTV